MTYFLNEQPPADTLAPRGNDLPLSSFLQGLGAGTRKAMLEHDANMIARRTTLHVQDDVAIQAGKLLGMDRVKSLIEQQNAKAIEMGMPSQVRDMPTSIDEIPTLMGPNFSKKLLEIAREDAAANPAKWQGIDLSQEGIDTETNARLQAEYREQQDTLDMMPSGRGAAETIGGIAAFAADAKNLPFLVAGGGEGALLKVLGREAMWNAASEAINLPAEFDMAKKLNIAPPSILGNLGDAAIGGAAIGGLVHAIGRGIHYFRERGRTSEVAGYGRDSSETIVSAAENALVRGEDPVAAATRAIQELPAEPPAPRQQVLSDDFKDWFGDSKATDFSGAPIRVFHGTLETFEAFDPALGGTSTGSKDAVGAIFFTDKPEVASTYAVPGDPYGDDARLDIRIVNKITGGLYEKVNEKALGMFGRSAYRQGGNLRPSYLSIKNPEIFDYGGLEYDPAYFEAIVNKAKKAGKDGIIIKNVVDTGTEYEVPANIYIVFNSDQVRSAFDLRNRPPLITESRLDPVQGQTPEPLPDPVIIGQAEAAIADAESAFANDFPEMRHKNPLAKKIQSMGGIQASRINPATGAREATQAAQELASMGVTTKTHPFLFRNKGMADLDNIPAADHLGLAEVLKVDQATGYFDRQDMLSALTRELTTGTKTAMSGEIAARVAELRRVSDPAARPETDFVSGQQSPTGWFVKPDDYDMFPDGRQMLADSFNKYLDEFGLNSKITAAERAEMLHELQTRGGDAEYLVSRTLERDLQFGEIPKAEAEQYDWIPGFDEPAPDGVSRQSGADTGRPGQDGAAARGGAEGDSGGQVLEATAAGDQYVAPGIEPVAQRQRLEARQETPMRGSARPMDDGLFDLGARQQIDMFSDPASAEARPILDTMTADIRDEITKGDDFLIDMGDGKGERMASTVLDDLDKGDAAAARFDLCGRGPA